MTSFAQWFDEAFSEFDPAEVDWTDKYGDIVARFPLDGKTYFVSFGEDQVMGEDPEWKEVTSISFGVLTGPRETPECFQTRAGNQFRVFGRVLGIIEQYLTKYRPVRFKFEAYSPGLERVYQRLVGQWAGRYVQVPGTFKFLRADIARKELSLAPGKYIAPESATRKTLPPQDPDQRRRRVNATNIARRRADSGLTSVSGTD